jgi:iron complex outermembrane receptor protein
LLSGGAGSLEKGFGAIRYGGRVGDSGWLRGYLKYFTRNHFDSYQEMPNRDDWHMARGGFRGDWQFSGADRFTLQGDVYSGECDGNVKIFDTDLMREEIHKNDSDLSGGNIIGRWHHETAAAGNLTLQIYYDRTLRDMPMNDETRDTWDIDLQHDLPPLGRHQVTWGVGFHCSHDDIDDCPELRFTPDSRTQYQTSAFVQDRISLFDDRLVVTMGSKFEHDNYSGFEIQPSLRLGWTPVEGQFFWASISRAVRTPSRADRDMATQIAVFPTGPTLNNLLMEGRNDFDSEELLAYEAGWRASLGAAVAIDVATYYNVYHDLRCLVPGRVEPSWTTFPPPPTRKIPLEFDNRYDQDIYGVEVSANYVPVDWWRLSCSYSWIHINLHSHDLYPGVDVAEGNSPDYTVTLRSYLDLPANFEFDTLFYYVDRLDNEYLDVSSYSRFDVRCGWHPRPDLELSFKVENLFESKHAEYGLIDLVPTKVPRSFYGKVTWTF